MSISKVRSDDIVYVHGTPTAMVAKLVAHLLVVLTRAGALHERVAHVEYTRMTSLP